MLLSKPVSYAVRALTYLAHERHEGAMLSSKIAELQSIPAPFLAKILGALTTAGIVTSVRGPGGGFRLAKDPAQISLYDVHVVFEGVTLTEECLLGHGKCSDATKCAVHRMWKGPKLALMSFLEETTIADLAGSEPVSKRSGKGQRR